MRLLKPTSTVFAFFLILANLSAFDAPAPPAVKTMEWTVGQAAYIYPRFEMEDTEVSKIIEWLDDSMDTPGFYLGIDRSQVLDRLGKTLTFKGEKITWLTVLGKVADAIDADIEIHPGEFKLVPRKAKNKEGQTAADEAGGSPK
jgi:hypothetical protein